MKWLVTEHRIVVIDAINDYAIYEPIAKTELDGYKVNAVGEHIVPCELFKGTYERCVAFIEALGKCLNMEIDAVPIEVVLEAMEPEKDEEVDGNEV